jgi:hypothetical protein
MYSSPSAKFGLPCSLCGHCQIPDIHTDFADFRVREAFKHVQLHIEWPIWILTRMIDSDEYQQIQSIGSMRYQNLLI